MVAQFLVQELLILLLLLHTVLPLSLTFLYFPTSDSDDICSKMACGSFQVELKVYCVTRSVCLYSCTRILLLLIVQ